MKRIYIVSLNDSPAVGGFCILYATKLPHLKR